MKKNHSYRTKNSFFFFFLLIFFFFSFSSKPPVNLVVNSSLCFSAMDNNPLYDEDAIAGQITVSSLVIQNGGSINYNDPGNPCSDPGIPNNGSQPITIIVTGDMTIETGGAINTENKIQAGNAGHITIDVGGEFLMQSGSLISSSNLTATAGGMKAGNITIHVTGDVNLEPNSVIKAFSYKGTGGTIEITSEENVNIDGKVLSESTGSGAGTNQGHGGMIWITAVKNLFVSDDGVISSKSGDPGADLVHLCACNITIYGLVQSTGSGHAIPSSPPNHLNNSFRPDKPSNSTAGVEVWASGTLLIDALNHNGQINADLCCGGGTAGTSWIDLFSQNDIIIIGGATAAKFAVHANGKSGNTDNGGIVTVKSIGGDVTANGYALQADGTAFGGSVVVEALNDVELDGAKIYARGDFNPMGGLGKGGNVSIRSFSSGINWPNGIGDVNPTGTGQTNVANRGVITFKKCTAGAVNVTGTTFPFLGGAATTPTTLADDCTGAPLLPLEPNQQTYVVFCECPQECSGSITITKVVVGNAPATDWEFTSTELGNFTLPAAGGSKTFDNLAPGVYTVTETLKPGYTASTNCGEDDNTATFTITENCEDLSCTFTNTEEICLWCNKGAVLSQVWQNTTGVQDEYCATPDIIVDLRLASNTVDATKIGTDEPATGSLQAAVNYMNAHATGDLNGDGWLFIGVTVSDCVATSTKCSSSSRPPGGDSPFGTENVVITNVHSARMNIFGCSVTMHAANANLPVITIENSVGKVTVLDIHVKYSDVEGYLIKNNADLVVVKNSRAMFNDIGYRVQDDDVQITGSPQISNNRIGILVEGGPDVELRTNSDIRDNSEVGVRITGNGNESNGNEIGISGHPNGVGMEVSGNNNDLHDDVIAENTGNGLVVSGNTNHIEGESLKENGGHGMVISGNSNEVIKNDPEDNTGDGIRVTGDNNILEGNTPEGNGGHGINADQANGASGNTLEDNEADDNALQGIRACGQTDLGNNDGTGNGVDPQVDFSCPDPSTVKFFVVDNDADKGFKYDATFNLISSAALSASGNDDAVDVATNGTNTFVLDNSDKKVYRYTGGTASKVLKNTSGGSPGTLNGIAIDGNDMWVADDGGTILFLYSLSDAFAASGNINASASINFTGDNGSVAGLGIDATYLYVLDDGDKLFYRYPRAGGAEVESKGLRNTSGGSIGTPTGAVLDGTSMWVVDANGVVYQYSLANLAFGVAGTVNASAQYNLYSADDDPRGIAVGTTTNLPSIANPLVTMENESPVKTNYLQVHPNPFSSTATIVYTLPSTESVSIKIYNSVGKEVATLVNARQTAGIYHLNWNAKGLSSDTYIIRYQMGSVIETGKIILIR